MLNKESWFILWGWGKLIWKAILANGFSDSSCIMNIFRVNRILFPRFIHSYGRVLLREAILWRTIHATMMSHVLSDDTLSLCRHWNQDLNMPRVLSTRRWGSLITAATIPSIIMKYNWRICTSVTCCATEFLFNTPSYLTRFLIWNTTKFCSSCVREK